MTENWRTRQVDDKINEYLAKSQSEAWKQVTKYLKAIKAQQIGLQRASRKIYRLRQLLIANGINPDNGPKHKHYALLKEQEDASSRS